MDGTFILWILIGLGFPIVMNGMGRWAQRQWKSDESNRIRYYRQAAGLLWVFMVIYLAIYLWDGAISWPWAMPFDLPVWIAAAGIIVYTLYQWRSLQSVAAEEATEIPERLGAAYDWLPQNREEWNAYLLMAISAGIVEEFLFRGFLFLSLTQELHWMWALALANVPFALAYLYVGWNNALSVYILGLVFTLLFYLTGNIWLSVMLHIVLEWSRGRMAVIGPQTADG
jgi:membrane protease YdiL (CAAX protease family)